MKLKFKNFLPNKNELQDLEAELNDKIGHKHKLLSIEENDLSNQGGTFAEMRNSNIKLQGSKEVELNNIKNKLIDSSSDILPFVIASDLIRDLSKQLNIDEKVKANKALNKLLNKEIFPIIKKTLSDSLKNKIEKKDTKEIQNLIEYNIFSFINDEFDDNSKQIHDFSSTQMQRFDFISNNLIDSEKKKFVQNSKIYKKFSKKKTN